MADIEKKNKTKIPKKNENNTKIRNGKPKPYFTSNGVVVGVKLSYFGSVFCFEVGKIDVKLNDYCLVNMENNMFWGQVYSPVRKAVSKTDKRLPVYGKILRIATEADTLHREKNVALEDRAFNFCKKRAQARKLDMKVVKAIFRFDRSKTTFLFTADGRIDFRELVKDLAGEFHTRIEMKQIGVRDEASVFGGYGCCGRLLCCSAYQKTFDPVSIRMAKVQNLTLDPGKISGVCGRLMCCLGYEYKTYENLRKELPRVGERVIIDGEEDVGVILELDVIKEIVNVEFKDGKVVKVKANSVKRIGFKRKATCKHMMP